MAERYFWQYVNLFLGSWKRGADMRMEGFSLTEQPFSKANVLEA